MPNLFVTQRGECLSVAACRSADKRATHRVHTAGDSLSYPFCAGCAADIAAAAIRDERRPAQLVTVTRIIRPVEIAGDDG